MSWLKRDDQRCLHPKVGELTDREYRALDALHEYCARARNGGYFDATDIRHAVYATPKGGRSVTRRELEKFVRVRLVDRLGRVPQPVDNHADESSLDANSTETQPKLDQVSSPTSPKLDLHKIHNWDAYQPKDPTGAERKRLERERKDREGHETVAGQSDDSPVTRHTDVTPSRARGPVPSRTDNTAEVKAAASTKSTTEHFESQHAENGHTSEIAAAQPLEAPRAATIDETARRHGADAAQVEPLAQAMSAEDFQAVAVTVAERCQTGQVRNPAGLLVQLLRERLTELAAEQRGQVVIPTVEQEIQAEFRLLATGGHPMDVALELLGRKLRRKGVDEGDWPRLIDLAVETFRAHEPSLA